MQHVSAPTIAQHGGLANPNFTELLDIQRRTSEELRHTANIVWQFSIAILTLQAGAIGLATQERQTWPTANSILFAGFFLSLLFSMMLVRQCYERKEFVSRIKAVEAILRESHLSSFFSKIQEGPFHWFKSHHLGWILFVESLLALTLLILRLMIRYCCCYC